MLKPRESFDLPGLPVGAPMSVLPGAMPSKMSVAGGRADEVQPPAASSPSVSSGAARNGMFADDGEYLGPTFEEWQVLLKANKSKRGGGSSDGSREQVGEDRGEEASARQRLGKAPQIQSTVVDANYEA